MKIGKVINLKDYSFILKFIIQNKIVIFSFIIFISGFIFGIFSPLRYKGFIDYFSSVIDNYLNFRRDSSIFEISLTSFNFNLNILITVFIIGTSLFAVVFLPFILFGYGIYYGSIFSLLYSNYNINGVVICGVIILPSVVIFTIGLLIAIREAIVFSLKISVLTLPNTNPSNLYYSFKNYCSKFILILIIIVISSLIDGILSFYLIDKFNI